jgi:4-hydroxy-tetrahydrodipicolinate synthase
MQRMCQHALNNDFEKALALDKTLQALHRTMIIEPNPIPVKWALHYLGKIANEIRLPLTQLSAENHSKIKQAIQTAGIYTQQFSF